MFVVGLVEKNVFAITALGRPFFEDAFFVDPVLGTEALPVDSTHLCSDILLDPIAFLCDRENYRRTLVSTLSKLDCYDLAWHDGRAQVTQGVMYVITS
jgi:hypothetical protein